MFRISLPGQTTAQLFPLKIFSYANADMYLIMHKVDSDAAYNENFLQGDDSNHIAVFKLPLKYECHNANSVQSFLYSGSYYVLGTSDPASPTAFGVTPTYQRFGRICRQPTGPVGFCKNFIVDNYGE